MNPLYVYIRQALQGCYPDSEAASLAKGLLTEVFGLSTLELYGGKDRTFSANEQKQLDDILVRLRNFEPFQYIIGVESFGGLTFEVNPHVLIPRPETLELVDWVVAEASDARSLRVLDVGTGSGCIAVSLAHRLPGASVRAWDVSPEALSVAARNAVRNGVQVQFEWQDVLQVEQVDFHLDVLISNPPYIAEQEKGQMEPNVLEWEPGLALFVPDEDPLRFYRAIARLGQQVLETGGKLYFEINQAYGPQTVALLEDLGYRDVELRQDLSHNDRMVRAVK